MMRNLTDLTEKDIQESCERMISDGLVFIDMSDYYADKLYEIHQEHIAQQEKTICGNKILNAPKTLKLVKGIYRQDNK